MLADDAEASLRTSELLELHVVPPLGESRRRWNGWKLQAIELTKRERP